MDLDNVLSRIKKLLNMAADVSSPEEAAIAANRATKLMLQYDVTMADVIAKDIEESYKDIITEPIHNAEYTHARYPQWLQWLSCGLAQQFNCHIKLKGCDNYKAKLHIFGYSSDVAIVKYLFSYLIYQLEKLADDYFVTHKAKLPHQTITKMKKEYLCGAVSAVLNKIKELYAKDEPITPTTSSGVSLMVIKQKAIEDKFGKFEYQDGKLDTPLVRMGYVEAQDKIHINKVIQNSSEEASLHKLIA